MPLFEFLCLDCGHVTEALVFRSDDRPVCGSCHGENLQKLISASSTASGTAGGRMPGVGDTTCCGSDPGHAGCAGPESCCGRH